jgi:hypothetical protein
LALALLSRTIIDSPELMAIVIAVLPVTIPAMVVPDGGVAAAFPVALKVLLAIVTRANPEGAFIGRTSPVTVVPGISRPIGIPVAFDKGVAGTRAPGLNPNHTRGGRRSNSDAYVKVGGKGAAARQ